MFILVYMLNYLKKYPQIVFIDLSAYAAKIISGSRFRDVLGFNKYRTKESF